MGKAISVCFIHYLHIIISLLPISHLSGGDFSMTSLGKRTKGRPPYVSNYGARYHVADVARSGTESMGHMVELLCRWRGRVL